MSRVFVTYYKRDRVVPKVWLPLGLAGFFFLVGVVGAAPIMAIPSAIALVFVMRNWPMMQSGRVALRLDAEGLSVDGLGFIHWDEVQRWIAGDVSVGGEGVPALEVAFRRPLPDILDRRGAGRLQPWQMRPFVIRMNGRLRLNLSRFTDAPDAIRNAFEVFAPN